MCCTKEWVTIFSDPVWPWLKPDLWPLQFNNCALELCDLDLVWTGSIADKSIWSALVHLHTLLENFSFHCIHSWGLLNISFNARSPCSIKRPQWGFLILSQIWHCAFQRQMFHTKDFLNVQCDRLSILWWVSDHKSFIKARLCRFLCSQRFKSHAKSYWSSSLFMQWRGDLDSSFRVLSGIYMPHGLYLKQEYADPDIRTHARIIKKRMCQRFRLINCCPFISLLSVSGCSGSSCNESIHQPVKNVQVTPLPGYKSLLYNCTFYPQCMTALPWQPLV